MYLYTIIIKYNFFLPIIQWSTQFKFNREFRNALSLFLAVMIGGTIYHFLRYIDTIYRAGFESTVNIHMIQLFIYLFFLTMSIMLSILFQNKFRNSKWSSFRFFKGIKIVWFLLLYSLCFLPMFSYSVGGLGQIFKIYKILFLGQ